ncbi:MAG: molecular chaperone DnaJ [Armatimonadaceae bacterium]
MVTEKRDYYEVLGLTREASPDEVKKAYRRLARQYHPDVNPGDAEAENRFKEVAEAYEVLSDEQKRRMYDQYGHNNPGAGNGFGGGFDGFGGFQDIFDIFFNGMGQGGRRGGPQPGSNRRAIVTLTLEEALRGVQKTARYQRIESCDVCNGSGAAPGTTPETCTTCGGYGQVEQRQNTILGTVRTVVPCPRCKGRGKTVSDPCNNCKGQGMLQATHEVPVSVPPGVETGDYIPVRGEGDSGLFGGPPGDLNVVLEVEKHDLFDREGKELFTEVPLTFAQAALGVEVPVPTVSGDKASITVPEGTQNGTTFRVRGQGMPSVQNPQSRGDLHVTVRVETPTKLSDEEKKLLRQFAELRGEKVPEHHKGFFDRLKDAFTHHDG